ncbi:extracellular solute-binding protein [Cohnella faecalis]|uniref:Extracellular solute-binding protein n=1 Tax=Cohnella faecalis TaxID=2315694 RepID=A0A398CE69_9BACL|nr:extracellular solute-binding protein [Cohnella faecalis]RIE00930.1 extracellular solute-binding protein [Cohnella faecalis]
MKVPTTFDEFVDAAAKLKAEGYTPIAVSGKEMWQLVRYLSFIPLRLTHTEFIDKLKTGDEKFTGEIGMKAANLLSTLGKGGYFQKGFSSMDYTQTLNFFLGGNAVIHYNGSWELAQFKDKYDSGEIGYFFIPEVAGAENNGPNTSITAGLAYAFNKETFDAETKRFFKFVVEHYNQAAFDVGGYLSPMNGDLPSNVFKLAKDFSLDLEAVAKGGVSWDDKLDPASNEVVGSTANELALGLITPEEFAEKVDKAIGRNAPSFFKDQK